MLNKIKMKTEITKYLLHNLTSAWCYRKTVNPPEKNGQWQCPKGVVNYNSKGYRNTCIRILLKILLWNETDMNIKHGGRIRILKFCILTSLKQIS